VFITLCHTRAEKVPSHSRNALCESAYGDDTNIDTRVCIFSVIYASSNRLLTDSIIVKPALMKVLKNIAVPFLTKIPVLAALEKSMEWNISEVHSFTELRVSEWVDEYLTRCHTFRNTPS